MEACLKDAGMARTDVDEIVIVGGSSKIPRVQRILSDFFDGKALNKSINPDEAVATGAAIQGAILHDIKSETIKDIVCIDVAPLSIGIETAGGVMATLINRNQTVPFTNKQTFTTHKDNQPGVLVSIYEGERGMCKDNRLLGKFALEGITPSPKGVPEIEVTFKVDTDGILSVSAVDKQTAKAEKIRITNDKGRLSKKQINEMI